MTTVILAEKPSVARDIARVVGARHRADGYLDGNGYQVTWALGHLVHFAEPDDYGAQWAGRWSLGQLPMFPEAWRLKTDERTLKQFQRVKQLINAADTERVVCATDAGREGEHIFRLIYEHARCTKPFDRLWVSSLTDEAIREGLRSLKPGSAFEDLGRAARARAQADWLVGMNLTRAYTVHNRVLCTIGRVQTPTLSMIVTRDTAIERFIKAYYYELVAHLAEGFDAKYAKDGETRIDVKAEAERLQRALHPHRTGTVRKVQKKIRHNRPPPLYDLTNLQRDANRRYGFTAAQVLEYAQALYETHKLISYPRTESRHIGEDMLSELPGILRNLDHALAGEALQRLEAGHKLGKAYVDRTKLTDHHAILPTGKQAPPNLGEPLRKIYDLIVTRFVAVFLPDQVVEETEVTLDIGGATFIARGTRVLEEGWKHAEPRRRQAGGAAESTDAAQGRLPPLTEGQTVHVDSLEVVEKETQPPKPYEDATLLAAMKKAGREIEDEALAEAMKDTGLGTPATRAEIIEKLIRTGYVERKRKQLRATEKGRALIALVAEPLRSPELTAAWEQRLKDVEQGQARAEHFYRDIVDFVRALLPRVAEGPALTSEQVAAARASEAGAKGRKTAARKGASVRRAGLGTCPVCGQGEVTETAKAYGCSRYGDGCGLTVWKTVAGLRLKKSQVRQLLSQGHTDRIEGFRSKAGKPFAARLRLDKNGKVGFDFEPTLPAEHEPGMGAGQRDRPPSRTGTDVPEDRKASPSGHAAPLPGPATEVAAEASLSDAPVTCPKCSRGRIIEGRRGYGCDRYREGCDFVVWKEIAGKRLNPEQICRLIATGRSGIIRGFKDEAGTRFDARLKFDGQWSVVFEPPEDE